MKVQVNILFFLFLPYLSFCQLGIYHNYGAKVSSLGNTGVAHDGTTSLFTNQAGILDVTDLDFQLNFQNRFELSDLSSISLAVVKSIDQKAIGINIQSYGLSEFKSNIIGLSYAMNLTNNFSIGSNFSFHSVSIQEYGSTSSFGSTIGIKTILNKELTFFSAIYNPIKISSPNADLKEAISIGIKWMVNKKVRNYFAISKVIDQSVQIGVGIEYNLIDQLILRTGFDTGMRSFTFGIGTSFSDKAKLDVGIQQHQFLGLSSNMSIAYSKS